MVPMFPNDGGEINPSIALLSLASFNSALYFCLQYIRKLSTLRYVHKKGRNIRILLRALPSCTAQSTSILASHSSTSTHSESSPSWEQQPEQQSESESQAPPRSARLQLSPPPPPPPEEAAAVRGWREFLTVLNLLGNTEARDTTAHLPTWPPWPALPGRGPPKRKGRS